jgi:hypothetical protein
MIVASPPGLGEATTREQGTMSLFERIGHRAELCAAMLRRLDIDPVETARIALGTRMASIARTCMLCRHSEACASWLSSSPEDPTAYRNFCPNAPKLDATRDFLAIAGRSA